MAVSYQDLKVWQKSVDLAENAYNLVRLLPKEELFSISAQIKRAAVSVPSNIAEGQQRNSTKEFINFLSIAKGSLAELETQIIICERLGFLTKQQTSRFLNESREIGLMLSALMNSLKTKNSQLATCNSQLT